MGPGKSVLWWSPPCYKYRENGVVERSAYVVTQPRSSDNTVTGAAPFVANSASSCSPVSAPQPQESMPDTEAEDLGDEDDQPLCNLIRRLPGCEEAEEVEVGVWLNLDEQFEVTDSSIIDMVNIPSQCESDEDDEAEAAPLMSQPKATLLSRPPYATWNNSLRRHQLTGGGGGGGGYLGPGGHAHSFAYFHGPVEGGHHEIVVDGGDGGGGGGGHGGGHGGHGHGGHHHTHTGGKYVDYVAHPRYEYAYGVADGHSGDHHSQKESRDGDKVVGEYTIKEPGGNVRTVKYHSDKKGGFFAEVHNSGGNDHSGGTYGGYSHGGHGGGGGGGHGGGHGSPS
ncbi:uncharacterized PE-PGRS family protein PE_PGRS20-like, partial [Schistocerca piceifrons]|uniref:uncharacterized PE-PGRS family protein PE_PGRS20-like n=1 Tax=Schistocerca piceifrons TaxID=274613 RepID=UPI001F5F1039